MPSCRSPENFNLVVVTLPLAFWVVPEPIYPFELLSVRAQRLQGLHSALARGRGLPLQVFPKALAAGTLSVKGLCGAKGGW